jgi:hypothetical protein
LVRYFLFPLPGNGSQDSKWYFLSVFLYFPGMGDPLYQKSKTPNH